MDHLLELTYQAERSHFWFEGFRRFVAPVLDQVAGGRRDLRILDCGCGTGHNLRMLTRYGHAYGVDLTGAGLQRARVSGLRVARGDVTLMPFGAGTFDVATSFDVLQCVPDDQAAVQQMAYVLKPGGRLVLTLAAFEMLRGDHSEVWHESHRYTPATARRLIESAGLKVERVSFLFATLFPLMLAVRVGQRALRPFRALRPDTDIGVPPAPVNRALTWLVSGEAALARRLPMPIGSSLLVVARKP